MIIQLNPDNFEEEVLKYDGLMMLLIWSDLNLGSISVRKEQEKLGRVYSYQLRMMRLNYQEMPDVASRLPFDFAIWHLPSILYIYKGILVDMSFIIQPGAIRTHIRWVNNFFNDQSFKRSGFRVSEDLIHPDAAGWCTPGINC